MIKTQYLLLIVTLFLLALPLFPSFVFSLASNSTYNFFNITNVTYFNWTSGNITIYSFNDSIQMNLDNSTTYINAQYNQKSRIGSDFSGYYLCFPNSGNLSFLIQNSAGNATNYTTILNNTNSSDFILSIFPFCPPGKYYGHFNVIRVGNTSDVAKVYTTIHVPLSLNNTLVQNLTNIEGYFKGTFYANDLYHSYYFNTSELNLTHITGLTLSLTELSQDLDIFVFNSTGHLMGKSIEKGSSSEQIIDFDLPTTSDRWEIRIYGNTSSDYRGDLYFSTLNITNVTYPDVTVSSLNFGDLNPNTTISNNFTLTNEDDRVLTSVYQYAEVYHVKNWPTQNQTKIFKDFLVPSFAKKIKVKINWTDESGKNITDWNLYLSDPAGNIIGSSTDKFILSNATNATREEFIEFNGPFNSSNEGYWNITVQNITNSTTPYSYYYLTAYVWMNENNWVSTDYTNGLNFNRNANYSYNISVNLTIPETQVLDGEYEGFLKYNSSQGWNTKLPISFNVSAGTLIINQSLNNGTTRLIDNIGFNRLGSSALKLNITFNNTGSYPIYYNYSTSNYTLTYGSGNISFTVDNWPSNPIAAGSSGTINITVSINTTNTSNQAGIYRGWIFFNSTNTTLSSSSYPYNTYNLSLEVNLTNLLNVQVIAVDTGDGNNWIENTSANYNITLSTKIFLMNGTQLFDTNGLSINNFTSSRMTEINMSTTYPMINITQRTFGSTNLCEESAEKCYVNVTTPTTMKGGNYTISLGVEWNNGQSVLTGNATYNSIVVRDTGLYMTCSDPSTCTINLNEGSNTTYFNVSVTNYGPINPSGGTISFINDSCAATITANSGRTTCTGTADGMTFTSINVNGNGTQTCIFSWRVISQEDVSANTACTFYIRVSNTSFHNSNQISGTLTVYNASAPSTTTTVPSSSTSSSTSSTSNASSKVSGTSKYLDITDYPTSISIEQGGNKKASVTVKNTNNTLTQNMILYVNGLNSSWYSVNPSTAQKLKRGESYVFEVSFNIPGNAAIGDYSAKFNATSLYINPLKPDVSFIYDTVLKGFTLKITPGEALKSEINSKLSQYKNDMNSLEGQINQSKSQNYNTSEAESLFNQLKTKINQANSYVSNSDYVSAYNLLDGISGLINQTKSALTDLKPITGKVSGIKGDWWSWGKWVVIVVVVIVAAVFGYMLWPTKMGETKPTPKAVMEKVVEGKKDKITETFAKLKEKWKEVREKKGSRR